VGPNKALRQEDRAAGVLGPPEPGPPPTASHRPLLTVEDLASCLSLSARGARQVLERGDLPGFRIGRRWYLRREDLEATVAARAAASRRDPDAAVRILRGLPGPRKARRKP